MLLSMMSLLHLIIHAVPKTVIWEVYEDMIKGVFLDEQIQAIRYKMHMHSR